MKRMESAKDGGWSWIVLIGVFGTNVLSFGFLQCTSVFFVDWQEDFEASAQAVGWTSAASICGFGISGFGTGIAFTNCILIVGYYFDKKLALAMGIGNSGSAGGMLVLAPLIRHLDDTYSCRGAVMVCGGILANICVFASLFRLTQAEVISMAGITPKGWYDQKSSKEESAHKENIDNGSKFSIDQMDIGFQKSTLKSSLSKNVGKETKVFVKSDTNILSLRFVMICIVSSVLTGFGYYTSLMYFVSNAVSLGIPEQKAAFLLSIFGICGTIGRLASRPVIDKRIVSPFYIGSFVLFLGGITCLLGSIAYIELSVFAVFLGLTGGTFNVFYPLLFGEVVGVFHFKKTFGIGVILWDTSSLIALPLIGHVYDITGDYRTSFYAAGGAMLLNSIVVAMDDVWAKLDKVRQRSRDTNEGTHRKESEVEHADRRAENKDDREDGTHVHDVGVCNAAFYIGQEDSRTGDHYL